MGRLKGSKNKKTLLLEQEKETINIPIIKRGRGRPRKNIMQTIEKDPEITGNKKEIILQIKRLRRLKLQCKAGNLERINLHRQIKQLKEKLNTIDKEIAPEKKDLIEKILKLKPSYIKVLNIDYTIFSIEELQKHYDLLLKGKNRL